MAPLATEAAIEHVHVGALLLSRDGLVPQPFDRRVENLLPEVNLGDLLKHFMIGSAEPRLRVSEDEPGAAGGC
jgi:hypothetical protein